MQADSFGQKGKVQEHAGSPVRRLARGVAILLRSPLRRIWQRPIQGVFYDGQLWDACSLVERLVARARASILLIDNWVGVETLDLLAKKRKGVSVTVVTSEHKDRRGKPRPTLAETDIAKFNAQYPSLTVRYSEKFHDRFLILDDGEIYLIGASLKDLGKKCFAFTKLDAGEIAGLNARL